MPRHFVLVVLLAALGGCAAIPQTASDASSVAGLRGTDTQATDTHEADAFATYLSARFAAGQHDMNAAAGYYASSLKDDPGNTDLLSLAFFYSTTAGDLDQAGKYATRIIAHSPNDMSARVALAVVAFKNKDYAGVRKALAMPTQEPFAALMVSLFDGWAAAGMGDAATAQAAMKTLSAQGGAEDMAAFHAALIADYMGKTDEADTDYQKALPANITSPRMLEAYGNFLERQGRAGQATAFYQKLRDSAALAPVVNAGLARIAAGKKPAPMIASPQDGAAEALFGIAASLTDAESANVSILYLRMALYLRPDLALGNILLADRFENLQKYDEALAIYRRIDTASPYYRMAATEAALNETRLDKTTEAIADLRNLTRTFPDSTESWIALGDALRDTNDNDAAITAYGQAEKTIGTPAKNDWPLFYARAMAEDKAHQWDKAEADIQTGLKLSPDQPELLNYLGYSWVDQGRRIPEALAMLEKASKLRPHDGYIADSVGWAYYRLGRYDDATRTLEAAVLLVPEDSTINDHLGDALWRDGQKMDARFQWYHALAFSDDAGEKSQLEEKIKQGLAG